MSCDFRISSGLAKTNFAIFFLSREASLPVDGWSLDHLRRDGRPATREGETKRGRQTEILVMLFSQFEAC
jgi:hypothetical protein